LLARKKFACRFQRDLGGLVDRIAVSAATDCWKCYHVDPVFRGQSQRIAMAICQRFRFTTFSATPDRSDSVNDKLRRQTVTASNLRFTGFTTAERPAFDQQFGAGCAVNRAIHSASAEECSVC